MSKKKIFATLISLMLVIGLLAGCTSKSAEEPKEDGGNATQEPTETVVLRLADNHNEGYPTVKADRKFAELVEEKTEGRVKIEVYPGGQLGDEKTVIEQVQFGAIDIARVSISPITEFDKQFNALMLPYLYRDKEHMFQVVDGPIGDRFLESLENNNFVGLGWLDAGARNFYNAKREVKTIEDMKGLKIRVQESQLMMDLVRALGASPTPMAFGEVYSALQTGVIDGAENNWPSYLSTSHYEVAKYFTVDEHTRVPELFLGSKMSFDKLSAEDQAAIKEAGQEAALFEREEWAKFEQEAEDEIVKNGNVITRLEAPAKEEFQKAVESLYDEHGAEYKDLIEEIINTK